MPVCSLISYGLISGCEVYSAKGSTFSFLWFASFFFSGGGGGGGVGGIKEEKMGQ